MLLSRGWSVRARELEWPLLLEWQGRRQVQRRQEPRALEREGLEPKLGRPADAKPELAQTAQKLRQDRHATLQA